MPVLSSFFQVIDLINDGTGLGFGIIGGQQTGVVVKTILPGGVADRDGRLLPGDFILQINHQWLKGDQQSDADLGGVASELRRFQARKKMRVRPLSFPFTQPISLIFISRLRSAPSWPATR